MKTSITDIESYRQVCVNAAVNESVFNTFKRHPVYKHILEHTEVEHAKQYLQIIRDKFPSVLQNIDKLSSSDSVGGGDPIKFDEFYISPSSLRYAKILGEFIDIFGSLDGLDIVEIGAGYGGQCKMIYDLFKPKSYTIIDLPEPILLTTKYLSKFGIAANTYMSEFLPDKNYDLAISNYAFSECQKYIQNIYIDKIFSKSKKVYIAANFVSDSWGISSFSKSELTSMLNLSEKPEEPLTHPNNAILFKN